MKEFTHKGKTSDFSFMRKIHMILVHFLQVWGDTPIEYDVEQVGDFIIPNIQLDNLTFNLLVTSKSKFKHEWDK